MRVTDPPAIKALAHPMRLDLLELLATEHEVSQVLGCHVEMRSEPGRDFPVGAAYQPANAHRS
jgi:hypothetical protein